MRGTKAVKTMRVVTMLAAFAGVMLGASVARAAQPVATCSQMPAGTLPALVTLCADTESSTVGSVPPSDFLKVQDRDGLVGKVVAAAFKMAQGKPCDADLKLRDYETALVLLMLTADSPKAKISVSKGDQLQGDLNSAQGAIAPLQCQ